MGRYNTLFLWSLLRLPLIFSDAIDEPVWSEEEIKSYMPDESVSLIESQISPDPFEGLDPHELIMSGKFSLVNVFVSPGALDNDGEEYGDVRADFCAMEYASQKADPSRVPLHRDIMGDITHCAEHRVSFMLADIVDDCRIADSLPEATTHSMAVKGIIYHLPKSGSSVLSNALAAAGPDTTRVVSESNAMTNLLKACHNQVNCSEKKQSKALADAIYLLGRTIDAKEENLYLRVDPIGSLYMNVLNEAFPVIPNWVFVVRDSDIVLSKVMDGVGDRRYYIKNRHNPHASVKEYVKGKSGNTYLMKELDTDEQVISATLGAIVNNALENNVKNPGLFVDYEKDILVDENFYRVLKFLGVNVEDMKNAAMVKEAVERQRNKRGNGPKSGDVWTGESMIQAKSSKVTTASTMFLKEEIDRVQAFNLGGGN